MVRNSQRTIYNASLSLATLLGKEYTALPNTTLNEKFNILPTYQLPEGMYPTLKYIGIGIGGNSFIEGSSKIQYSEHSPLDGACFEHVPFIMKKIDQDLTMEERLNYRFRIVENFEGEQYVCYYLKKISTIIFEDFFYNIKNTVLDTGETKPSLLIADLSTEKVLDPIPKIRSINYQTATEQNYILKLAKVVFNLSSLELNLLNEVFEIKKIENRMLTEIMLCTGVDVTMADTSIEAGMVQAAMHVGTSFNILKSVLNKEPLNFTIELGGSEPILK